MPTRTVNDLSRDASVKAYVQHGFIPESENSSQIVGTCPFCSKVKHFYVNKKTKEWKCHSGGCGLTGGYKTFLEKIVEVCQKDIDIKLAQLGKKRGVKVSTLKHFNVGFNKITKQYCFPVRFRDGKLIDVRVYFQDKEVRSTAGCKNGLIGLTKEKHDTIILCEGEWDAMVMHQIIKKLKLKNTIALGVPGAGTFKGEWQAYFKNKNVICIYDRDKAGDKGSLKAFNMIKSVTQALKFLRWGKEKTGFDLTNLFKRNKLNHTKTYKYLMSRLHEFPECVDKKKEKETKEKAEKESGYERVEPVERTFVYDGEGLEAQEVYDGYKKHLHLPDTDCIDYMYSLVLANREEGINVWGFITAPSGFIKTTFITSITGAQDIHEEDNMSSAGLVSGFTSSPDKNNKKEIDSSIDNSLLPELNGMTLAIQDLTSLLSDREENKRKTFGIFRSCFDGKYKHRFGNVKRIYISSFGMLAGVTPAGIHLFEAEGALGERFISFEMKLPDETKDEIAYIMRAMTNASQESKIKEALIEIGTKTLNYDYLKNFPDIAISDKLFRKVAYLSLFISIMRGKVEYDKYSKLIDNKAQREIATRLSKQLVKMLRALCRFRRKRKATMDEYDILKRIAISTIPDKRHDLVSTLYYTSIDGVYTGKTMSRLDGIRLSRQVCEINARKLSMLDVLVKHHREKGDFDTEFTFNEEFINTIREARIY